jgi:hypothetical protein
MVKIVSAVLFFSGVYLQCQTKTLKKKAKRRLKTKSTASSFSYLEHF